MFLFEKSYVAAHQTDNELSIDMNRVIWASGKRGKQGIPPAEIISNHVRVVTIDSFPFLYKRLFFPEGTSQWKPQPCPGARCLHHNVTTGLHFLFAKDSELDYFI